MKISSSSHQNCFSLLLPRVMNQKSKKTFIFCKLVTSVISPPWWHNKCQKIFMLCDALEVETFFFLHFLKLFQRKTRKQNLWKEVSKQNNSHEL